MAITKKEDGWIVDIRPEGAHGKRVRKSFKTKAEALRYEAYARQKAQAGEPWQGEKKDMRRLSELASLWYTQHGITLKDGKNRESRLKFIIQSMGDPRGFEFDATMFADFRAKRLESVGENTANHDLAYLRAMFNELRRMGQWKKDNPISLIRKLKVDERDMGFLTHGQIDELLGILDSGKNPDAGKVARVCLATGARWSEAETLRTENVSAYRVTFGETKSGKVRSVPITQELFESIQKPHGRLFTPSYNTFRAAVKKCSYELAEGQMTHVLRHTFASHFMQNGGNILTLQKILGHQSLQMTMRYAHLAPEHLEEATRLNPLSMKNRNPV